MDDFASRIEALEHRWMRAWASGDRAELKSLSSRDFIFLFGANRATLLDRASWLEAAGTLVRCEAYRFGGVYVRRHGSMAIFAAPVEIEAKFESALLTGTAFITDVWRRTRVKRRWQLIERVLSRSQNDDAVSAAIRSMQLWRS